MRSTRFVVAFACGVVSLSSAVAKSQSLPGTIVAFPPRPASVPADYVAAPDGLYHHKDCLIHMKSGELLEADGYTVDHLDGTKTTEPKCTHPTYDHDGHIITDNDAIGPYTDGWIAAAKENLSSVTWLSAGWTVPANPSSYDSQILYFFPAMAPSDASEVVQPVLGWNFWGTDGNGWRVAAVWCPKSPGSCAYDGDYTVSVGDSLSGYMYPRSNPAGWVIGMNVNGGLTAYFSKATTTTYNVVTGGALESYLLSSCSDYPNGSSGSTTFSSIAVYQNGVKITPSWTNQLFVSQCSSGVSSTSTSATITY